MTIQDNYFRVIERIYKAAMSAGRDPDDIRLVVVTKTHNVEKIQEVIDAGAKDLGENYVEDAVAKIGSLTDNQDIKWHMIGHVQSRKASTVCQYFEYIHSIDSLKLAERIDRFSGELNKKMPVWIEVNVSGEKSKSGWSLWNESIWKDIIPEFQKIFTLPNINVLGLMTVPPYSEISEQSRPYYRKLRKLQEYLIAQLGITGFNELSIGMSNDYEIAIQEGSTCVRIGQAILGARNNL